MAVYYGGDRSYWSKQNTPKAIQDAIYAIQLSKSKGRRLPSAEEEAISSSIYNKQLAESRGRQLPSAEELAIAKSQAGLERLPTETEAKIASDIYKRQQADSRSRLLPGQEQLSSMKTLGGIEDLPRQRETDRQKDIYSQQSFADKTSRLPAESAFSQSKTAYDTQKLGLDRQNLSNIYDQDMRSRELRDLQVGDKLTEQNRLSGYTPMQRKAEEKAFKNMDDSEKLFGSIQMLRESGKPELADKFERSLKNKFGIGPDEQLTYEIIRSKEQKPGTFKTPGTMKYIENGITKQGQRDPQTGLLKKRANDPVIKERESVSTGLSNRERFKLKNKFLEFSKLFNEIPENDKEFDIDDYENIPNELKNVLDSTKSNMINKKLIEKYFFEFKNSMLN